MKITVNFTYLAKPITFLFHSTTNLRMPRTRINLKSDFQNDSCTKTKTQLLQSPTQTPQDKKAKSEYRHDRFARNFRTVTSDTRVELLLSGARCRLSPVKYLKSFRRWKWPRTRWKQRLKTTRRKLSPDITIKSLERRGIICARLSSGEWEVCLAELLGAYRLRHV